MLARTSGWNNNRVTGKLKHFNAHMTSLLWACHLRVPQVHGSSACGSHAIEILSYDISFKQLLCILWRHNYGTAPHNRSHFSAELLHIGQWKRAIRRSTEYTHSITNWISELGMTLESTPLSCSWDIMCTIKGSNISLRKPNNHKHTQRTVVKYPGQICLQFYILVHVIVWYEVNDLKDPSTHQTESYRNKLNCIKSITGHYIDYISMYMAVVSSSYCGLLNPHCIDHLNQSTTTLMQ